MPTAARPQTKRRVALPRKPANLRQVLGELHEQRPERVPEHATLLVAWVDLPGDNAQRTQHWAAKRRWQEAVKDHFALCLSEQPHPGLLQNPQVHIQLYVAAPGDERNRTGRAKYIIDKLQVRREVSYLRDGKAGTRVHGGYDLIADDKMLNDTNCVIEEIRTKADSEHNPRRVQVWVWEAA
ncbi:hypothetical protein [Deinococcus sp. S9]|uniref:hypothetical protein n=1 Tax=Deinococcus sp. S9 TaxID=2545754 RepID=UPI0010555579|nr:hypothetical protein [Deinococcus sp. S9]TDE87349.1 hypothetical protein E0686_02315 [Deinococcus sp. S9]